jgi:hypothetical protein
LTDTLKRKAMRPVYCINSMELGEVFLKRRKIAKALRLWLNENGYIYKSSFYFNRFDW